MRTLTEASQKKLIDKEKQEAPCCRVCGGPVTRSHLYRYGMVCLDLECDSPIVVDPARSRRLTQRSRRLRVALVGIVNDRGEVSVDGRNHYIDSCGQWVAYCSPRTKGSVLLRRMLPYKGGE